MKKLIAIAAMVLALAFGANAQSQQRLWNQGPLSWADFQVRPTDSVHTSWLHFSFKIDSVDKVQGMKMCRTKVVCYADPQQSWVMDDYMTDQELKYNQVLFNLAEIQCRMFQPSLDLGLQPMSDDSLLSCIFGYCQYEEDRFVWESEGGQVGPVVDRWLDSTNSILAEMPAQDQFELEPSRDWGFAGHMGMGYSYPGKGIHNTFRNPFSFQFGFECDKRNHAFIWDFLIGGAGTNSSFVLDGYTFPSGKAYTWFQMGFDYGYYVVSNPHYSVMPFVGLGFTGISATAGYDEDAPSYGDACGSWFAGVSADWALSNKLWCPYYDGTRDQEEVDVRLMLYAARSALYGYKSVSLNAALSFNFSVRNVKMKYTTSR